MKKSIEDGLAKHAHLNYSKDLTDLIAELLQWNRYKRLSMANLRDKPVLLDFKLERASSSKEISQESSDGGREPQDAQPLDWSNYADMKFASRPSAISERAEAGAVEDEEAVEVSEVVDDVD